MRIDYRRAFPAALKAILGLEEAVHGSSLEPALCELVKMRASQLNGCAHCLDMHSKDARAMGEEEQRLYLLDAWREAPCYSDRERAAPGLVRGTHVAAAERRARCRVRGGRRAVR